MKRFVEPPLISCSLTFCSLSNNQIEEEGAHEIAAALKVNQSLQELEWVLLLRNCAVTVAFFQAKTMSSERGRWHFQYSQKCWVNSNIQYVMDSKGVMFCCLLLSYLTFFHKALAIQRVQTNHDLQSIKVAALIIFEWIQFSRSARSSRPHEAFIVTKSRQSESV